MKQCHGYTDLTKILRSTPGNPVIWETFLEHLAKFTGAESSYMLATDIIHRDKAHFLFSFNIPNKQLNRYTRELNKLDTFSHLLEKNPYHVFCSQKHQTTINNDDTAPADFQYRFGFAIPCNTHHSLSLCINRTQPFSQPEQKSIHALLQALITPLENTIRTELQQKIYSQILHHTHDCVDAYIIIDRSLGILFFNASYASVLDKFHCINIDAQQISFNNPEVYRRLSFLIDNNEIASLHNQCDACLITLIPVTSLDNLYNWECFKEGFILAFTHDKASNPIIERLINIHELSRCEALCALDFMQSPSIADIANNNCRSENTVRNHIKHIMQKMEVHNQAALMKKLITLATL